MRYGSRDAISRSARAMALVIAIAFAGLPALADRESGPSAFDFAFTAIEGDPLPLAQYRGKAILLVNTASRCGFTHQYADLQRLWRSYRDRGLIVLAVPSNDFGGQEPGQESEIKEFCEVNFDVDFPMTTKERVTGAKAHPFYLWALQELGPDARPQWNFHKYLIAPNGSLVRHFSTRTSPSAEPVTRAIEELLTPADSNSG